MRWHWVLLLLLMASWASALVFSTILTDPARDLSAALRLAQDGEWPLLGPLIGERFHLGPIWFWLLGGLLWLLNDFVLLALAVGLIGALKFPFAWLCAREWGSPRLGLIWAGLLAFPGWHSVAQFGIGHTVPLEAMLLWMTWCSIRFVNLGRGGSLALAGLAFAMAVHCHPSAVIAGIIPFGAWVIRCRREQRLHWWPAIIALFMAALPFLPLVLANEPILLGESAGLVGSGLMGRWWALLVGVTAGSAQAAADFMLQPLPGATRWPWLAAVLALVALIGLVRIKSPWRKRLLISAVLFAFSLLWLVLVRDRTPPYMTYLLSPMITFILALGLVSLSDRRWMVVAVGTVGLSLAMALTAAVYLQANQGLVLVPATQLSDVAAPGVGNMTPASVMPVWAEEENGRRWCEVEARDVTLHGDLAAMTDMSLALATQQRCHGRKHLIIGGAAGERHEFALPAQMLSGIVAADAPRLGNLVSIESFEVHHPEQGASVADGQRYPPHPGQGPPTTQLDETFRSGANSYLTIVELIPWFAPSKTPKVWVNGERVEPIASSRYTRIYPCRRCAWLGAHWQVQMVVSDASRVELITFKP